MKVRFKNSILILVILLAVVLLVTGCNQSSQYEDDYEDELADVDLEWPDYAPASLPEFTDGRIVHASGQRIGGQDDIKIGILEVTQEEFDEYIIVIEEIGYSLLNNFESKGTAQKTYVDGENAMSLKFDSNIGDLVISFTGN